MSRVGKLPIQIPGGVQVSVNGTEVSVKGPKGTLVQKIDDGINVNIDGSVIVLTRATEQKRHRAMHGLYRALNWMTGYMKQHKKQVQYIWSQHG